MFIIAMFLLGISGCGYKADPFFTQETSHEDEHVKIIKKELVK